MNDLRFFLSFYQIELWKRRWSVLLIAWFVALMGIFIVMLWPDRYQSSAQIYVDTDALLAQILENSALPQETEQKIDNIRLLMYARPNLQRVLKNTDLDTQISSASDEERVIKKMREDLELLQVNNNVYRINYFHSDPAKAQRVVQEILSNFLDASIQNVSKSSEKSVTYAQGRVKELREQLSSIQNDVATFRSQHVNQLQDKAVLLNELRNAEEFLANAPAEKRALEGRINSMQAALSQTPKSLSSYVGGGGMDNSILADDCGIPALEAEISKLVGRGLTEAHPDVKMYRSMLQKRRAECTPTSGGGRSGGGGRTVSQQNPMYLQMQDQISSFKTQLQQTADREGVERANKLRIEKILAEQPELIERLRILESRSETLFTDLRTAENDLAKVQQTIDTNRKLSLFDYTVMEQPIIPRIPEAPNRLMLFMGVFVASIMAGIGVVVARMQMSDNLPTLRHLKLAFDLPILGSVSEVEDVSRNNIHIRFSDTAWYGLFALMTFLFVLLIYFYHVLGKRPDITAVFRYLSNALGAAL